jgi:hypothetical protein
MTAWAFSRRANPFGARLNAIFGSDIGHFDVPDMLEVLPEAYELVEDELITAADFRDFTLRQRRAAVGHPESELFRGHRRREGGRRGAGGDASRASA